MRYPITPKKINIPRRIKFENGDIGLVAEQPFLQPDDENVRIVQLQFIPELKEELLRYVIYKNGEWYDHGKAENHSYDFDHPDFNEYAKEFIRTVRHACSQIPNWAKTEFVYVSYSNSDHRENIEVSQYIYGNENGNTEFLPDYITSMIPGWNYIQGKNRSLDNFIVSVVEGFDDETCGSPTVELTPNSMIVCENDSNGEPFSDTIEFKSDLIDSQWIHKTTIFLDKNKMSPMQVIASYANPAKTIKEYINSIDPEDTEIDYPNLKDFDYNAYNDQGIISVDENRTTDNIIAFSVIPGNIFE